MEKFGKMVFEGRIFNLDLMSVEELQLLEKKMLEKQEELRTKIDELVSVND